MRIFSGKRKTEAEDRAPGRPGIEMVARAICRVPTGEEILWRDYTGEAVAAAEALRQMLGDPDVVATVAEAIASEFDCELKDLPNTEFMDFIAAAKAGVSAMIDTAISGTVGASLPIAASTALEEAAAVIDRTANLPAEALRLQYGEMSAQEIRTLRAVLEQQVGAIMRMASIDVGDEEGDYDIG